MSIDVQTALANEARRSELRQKRASLKGAADAVSSVQQRLAAVNNDTVISLQNVEAELAALEAGAGPGVTADYGPKSTITQMIEAERWAAKEGVIDYVKANPGCTEEEANTAWNAGALAAHPEFPMVMQDGISMSRLYRANLLAAGMISEDSWEAHRDWIATNDKTFIMGL